MTFISVLMSLPIVALAFLGMQLLKANNRLVALNQRCNTAFADTEVFLKRRADLIPSLVECVKGFSAHERSILDEVVKARAGTMQSDTNARLQAEQQLGRKITSVINLSEKYPDLAASAHFRELRAQLVETENRIAASRRFYNLTVEEYNATHEQFPGNVIAARRNLAERRPFDLGIERVLLDEPVTVKF